MQFTSWHQNLPQAPQPVLYSLLQQTTFRCQNLTEQVRRLAESGLFMLSALSRTTTSIRGSASLAKEQTLSSPWCPQMIRASTAKHIAKERKEWSKVRASKKGNGTRQAFRNVQGFLCRGCQARIYQLSSESCRGLILDQNGCLRRNSLQCCTTCSYDHRS